MATRREYQSDANPQASEDKEKRLIKTDDPGVGPEGIVPNLQSRIVVGVFDRREQAEAAREALQAAGYTDEDVSVVMQPAESAPEVPAGETKADQGSVAGVSAGAVVGGALGLAALAIPGIGPLLAIGPIAAALGGAVAGGALGGLIGSFAGLGIPTEHAKEYEAAVRSGGIVVAIKVPDGTAGERAGDILRQQGAREVASYNQAL